MGNKRSQKICPYPKRTPTKFTICLRICLKHFLCLTNWNWDGDKWQNNWNWFETNPETETRFCLCLSLLNPWDTNLDELGIGLRNSATCWTSLLCVIDSSCNKTVIKIIGNFVIILFYISWVQSLSSKQTNKHFFRFFYVEI